MNLSIVDRFGYNLSPHDRMRLIKRAGFDGVLLLWADYFDLALPTIIGQNRLKFYCRKVRPRSI